MRRAHGHGNKERGIGVHVSRTSVAGRHGRAHAREEGDAFCATTDTKTAAAHARDYRKIAQNKLIPRHLMSLNTTPGLHHLRYRRRWRRQTALEVRSPSAAAYSRPRRVPAIVAGQGLFASLENALVIEG